MRPVYYNECAFEYCALESRRKSLRYGNGATYQKIFEANREVIKDPDKIFPGQKTRIPENI